jgi:hypothetical protein
LNEAFLETEKLVHSLADELLKLKSAVEQYENNRKSLDAVRESVQKIGNASVSLADNTKSFFAKLDGIGLEKRLSKLQDDSSSMIEKHQEQTDMMTKQHEQQSKAVSLVDESLRGHDRIMLQNHKEQTDRMNEQHLQQSKALDLVKSKLCEKMLQIHQEQTKKLKLTQVLVIILLALEAATLATIFLR